MVIYEFPYKLIVAPILVIIFSVALFILIRKPSLASAVGVFLLLFGAMVAFVSPRFILIEDFFFGLAIMFFSLTLLARPGFFKKHLTGRSSALKKAAYALLAVIIVASSLVLSVRATTNMLREDHLENYHGSSSSNLMLRGNITAVQFNHEEAITGYVYHIFHACVTLNVTDFVWSGQMHDNSTSSANYWLNKETLVYYDWTDAAKLAVGQTVEVKGYYCHWAEDSLYSVKFVVDPAITDSYINQVSL